MGYRVDQEKIKELILTVRGEYETFKTGMLMQSSDKVFENHAQIHFYCRLNDYFSRDISDFDVYEKREIRKLQQTAPKDTLSRHLSARKCEQKKFIIPKVSDLR